ALDTERCKSYCPRLRQSPTARLIASTGPRRAGSPRAQARSSHEPYEGKGKKAKRGRRAPHGEAARFAILLLSVAICVFTFISWLCPPADTASGGGRE